MGHSPKRKPKVEDPDN